MDKNRNHLHTGTVSVRWTDIDPYGMVNHSKYFTFMEEIRWQWVYSLKLQNSQYAFPIVELKMDFKKQIIFPANVIIKLFSEKPDQKSWIFYHEIFTESESNIVHAIATVKSVCYSTKEKKVVEIPKEFLKFLYPETL